MSAEPVVVGELRVRVLDRGPEPEWHRDRRLFGPWCRYEAALVDDSSLSERGLTPWEAVYRLVANGRVTLTQRWSPMGAGER